MKKKIISLLLMASMATLGIVGCGSTTETEESTESSTSSAGGEAETISFMCWYDESNMQSIIDAINEELNGAYEVEYTYVSLDDYNNVLSTQLAAGEGPDIVADGTNFPARIKAGNVLDITDEEYLSSFNEAGFSLTTADGKIYGIPSYGWFSGVWYNKDILDECEVEIPNTFEEYINACEIIAEKGYTPAGFGLADGDTANHSLYGYLENEFYHNNSTNTDGTEFDEKFANGEKTLEGNWTDSVSEWYELIEKGIINSEMLGISNEEALNSFIAGNTAFFNGGPWQYSSIKEAGFNFGMMPHLTTTGENVYMLGGPAVNFGINVNTKNLDGAKAVLEALSSIKVQQAFVDANVGGFSYREGVEAEMPNEYSLVADIVNSGNIESPWDRWAVNMPSQSLVDESVSQLQGLISGDISVDEYIRALDSKADSIRYQ